MDVKLRFTRAEFEALCRRAREADLPVALWAHDLVLRQASAARWTVGGGGARTG